MPAIVSPSPLDIISICDAGRAVGSSDGGGAATSPVWCLLYEDEPLLLLGMSGGHDTVSRCVHHIGIPPPYIQTPSRLAHSPQALNEICGIARHRHAELIRGGGENNGKYNASKPVKVVQGVAGQLVPIYTAILVLQADVGEVCDALRQYGVHPHTEGHHMHHTPPPPQGTPTNPVIEVISLSSSVPCRTFPGGLVLHVGEAPPPRDHDDSILYPRGAGYNMALTLEPRGGSSGEGRSSVGLLSMVCNTTVEEEGSFSNIIQVCICSVVNLWRGCTIGGLRRLLVGPSDMPLRQVHLSGFAKHMGPPSLPQGPLQLHTDLEATNPQHLQACKIDSSLGLVLHGCVEGDEFTIPQPLPPSNTLMPLMPGQPDPNARLRYNFRPLALGDSLMASTASRSNVASRTQSRLESSPNPVRPTTHQQQQPHHHTVNNNPHHNQQHIQISFDPPSATEESEGSSMASERVRELQYIADRKYGGSYAAAVRAKYLAAKGKQQLKAHDRVRALIGSSSSDSGSYSSSSYTSDSESDETSHTSSSSPSRGDDITTKSVHHASVYSNAPTSAADRTLSLPTANNDINRTQSAAYRGERLADHVQHMADQIIIGDYPTELATMSDVGTTPDGDTVSAASRVPKSATSTVRRTPYSTPLSLDKVQEPLLSPFKLGFTTNTVVPLLPHLEGEGEDDMVDGEEYNSTPQRSARVVPTDSEISTEPTLEELVFEVDRHLKRHGGLRRSTPRSSPPAHSPSPPVEVVTRREVVVEERSLYAVESEEREIVVVVPPRPPMAVESRPWSVASGAPPRTAESPIPSSPDLCPGFTEEEGSRLGGRGDESDEVADLPIDEDTHRTYHAEELVSLPITRTNSKTVSRTQSKTVRFSEDPNPSYLGEVSMVRRVHSMNVAIRDEEEVALAMQEEDAPRLYATLLAANAPEACELRLVVEHIPRAGQGEEDEERHAESEEEMVLEMQQEDLMRTYAHLLTSGAQEVLELLHVVKEDGGRLADDEEEPDHSGPPQYEDLPRLYDVLLRAGAPEACELLQVVAETVTRLVDDDEEAPIIVVQPPPMAAEDQRRKVIEEEASPPANRPVAKEEVAHHNTEEVAAVVEEVAAVVEEVHTAVTPRRMFMLLPGTRPINLGRRVPSPIPQGSPRDGLVVEGYSTHGFALEKLEGEAMAGEERARSLSPVLLNRSSSQPLGMDGGRRIPSPQHNYHHTAPSATATTPRRTPRIGLDARPRVVAHTTPAERVFGTSRKLFVFENDSPRKPATTIMLRTAHNMQSFRTQLSQRLGIMNLGDIYHIKGNRIVDIHALADGEPIVVCRRGGARFTPYNLPDQLNTSLGNR